MEEDLGELGEETRCRRQPVAVTPLAPLITLFQSKCVCKPDERCIRFALFDPAKAIGDINIFHKTKAQLFLQTLDLPTRLGLAVSRDDGFAFGLFRDGACNVRLVLGLLRDVECVLGYSAGAVAPALTVRRPGSGGTAR